MSLAPLSRPLAARDLTAAARARLRDAPVSVVGDHPLVGVRADVVLDGGEDGATTVVIWDGRVSAHPGRTTRPATRVVGDVLHLLDIIEGRRSGVEAFLSGDIDVTGNVALSLQLDGLFRRRESAHQRAFLAGTVVAGGVRTSFLESGPRHGRPVVLLHGLGATNASMLPLAYDLAADHRVIVPDLPGHGASAAPRGRYDAAWFADWLAALLGSRSPGGAVVIGNSLGGRIGLELALGRPELVEGLVLLAPAVAFRKLRQLVPVVRLLRPEVAALPLPITDAAVMAGLRLLFARPERLSPAAYRAAAGEFGRVTRDLSHRIAFTAALRQIYLDDPFGAAGFWKRLPSLSTPSLWVWGRQDRLVPAGFARHVCAAVPACRTVVFDGCGHIPQFELPAETALATREFLAALPR